MSSVFFLYHFYFDTVELLLCLARLTSASCFAHCWWTLIRHQINSPTSNRHSCTHPSNILSSYIQRSLSTPMAPAKTAPTEAHKRQPRTGPHRAAPIVKPRPASSTRKSLRLQNKTPVSHTSPPQPVQSSPIRHAPISQTASAKRKLSQNSQAKAERPVKQP